MKPFLFAAPLGLSILALTGGVTAARADRALVVGVNEYPALGRDANLEGCVNDAHNIEKSLRDLGFEVTSLTNEKATKQGILTAFDEIKRIAKPNERFVFYFAGHGTITSDGSSALLPCDASDRNEKYDLGRDDLYNATMSVPARSRTTLLDACFSGGLSRAVIGHKVKKSRYYRRPAGAATRRDIGESNNQDNNNHVAGKDSGKIVYFTASLANQTSGEDDFEGVRGGVFTHFLTDRLGKAAKNTLWNQVQKDVTGQVADYMDQTQTPKLSPVECADLPIFSGKEDPSPVVEPVPNPAPKPDRTLWDDFNEDRSDPANLVVLMQPNRASVNVKQQFTFEAKTGDGGWLVLLEKDTDGKVYLLWPRSRKLEDARVEGGKSVRLPTDKSRSYRADTKGVERVKAILFTTEENARALLVSFPPDGAEPAKLRRITESSVERRPFYTSSFVFGVE